MSIVLRRVVKAMLIAALLVIAFVLACNVWIVQSTSAKVITQMNALPDHRVALVLGTSHKLVSGGSNPFFETRVNKAAELYKMGKIDHFILSGDNRSIYYNEPMAMRKALVQRGVPDIKITLDYAGLRTLDSVVRCQKIFGQNKIIIITQPFHSYRALFISNYYDIDAVAMVADEPDFDVSVKVRLREYVARAKAVLDLYILKTAPRFLGEKEQIKITTAR